MTILKSIGAALAGIVVGVIPTLLTDYVLESNGVLPNDNLYVATWLIWVVLAYRIIYTVIGCYVTARLAPRRPMLHANIVAGLGVVASAAGAYATRDMNLGPQWYAWTLAVLTIPTGYVAGIIHERTR